MNTQIALPRLGLNILVIVDRTSDFLDRFQAVIARLPDIQERSFQLLCCCPTRYWEHGLADDAAVNHETEAVWQEEEKDFDVAGEYLNQARAILEALRVPPSQIRIKTGTDDSTMDATMAEIRRGHYSGIVVSRSHEDIVNRLLRKGLTDVFRDVPNVGVLAIDSE